MTQQIINVGNAVNDGTGESLRSAFQAVNDNFSNVWAAGPVDSQVVIRNNVVSTNLTNRNLVLAANGVGVITVATTVVPSINSVFDLGTANNQFDSVYARYYYGNAARMTGLPEPANLLAVTTDILPVASQAFDLGSGSQRWNSVYARDGNFSRNVTVSGNLTVMGDVIEMGNSVTDSLRLQLANSAVTSAAANGAGITVGASDNIATVLYDSANNVWTTNIGVSVDGAITGISVAVSDATVYGNVDAINGNFTGNVSADYFIGDGSLLTGLPAGYANADAVAYGESGWAGNIVPSANVTYSLGNSTNQWKDLWVSNSTIYINSVPVTIDGTTLQVNGSNVVTAAANGTVDLANLAVDNNNIYNTQGQGVVISNFSFIDEAETAYVQIPAGNSASDLSVVQTQGNVRIASNGADWTFGTDGLLTLPSGNVAIGLQYGSEAILATNTSFGVATQGNATTFLNWSDDVANTSVLSAIYINDPSGNTGDIAIRTGAVGNAYVWRFEQTGNLTLPSGGSVYSDSFTPSGAPGNTIVLNPHGSGSITNQKLMVYPTAADGDHIHMATGNLYETELFLGNDNFYVKLANTGNVVINSNDNTGNIASWTFGSNGSTIFPTLTVDLHNGGNQSAQTLQFGDTTQQAVITGPAPAPDTAAQRLIIQGQRGNGLGEGGDVYLWAGDAEFNGGDIKIYAGNADDAAAGSGGYINLDGGSGFNGGGQISITGGYSPGGQGGPVYISAGQGTDGGVVNINGGGASTATGGYVNIQGGFGQGDGGAVTIAGGGSALGLPGYGNVQITAGVSTWTFDNTGTFSAPGNVSATYFIGDGSQLTGLPASYSDSNVASFLAAFGSNTVSTTGNITAGNFIGSGANVDIAAGSYDWTFDNSGNLTAPGDISTTGNVLTGFVILSGGIVGSGASPAPYLSGFSTVQAVSNITGGNILTSGLISAAGNVTGNYILGNGSQLTAVNAATVDVLNTNGLTTTFYPTFVENRDSAEIVRADVDLTYRTDTNTLGVGSLSAAGNVTGNYILGNGSQLTGLPATYGNSNVTTLLSAYGSNTISTSGNITAGNLIGNISITGNVTGTSANVTLMASTYSWTFDNTGNLALPGNTFAVNYANGTAVSLGGNYGNANVVANLAALGSNPVSTTGNVTSGNLITAGAATTGVNALLAGPSFTPLANTSAGFVANVNSYSQVTFQNKNTGADATADYILTADNGSDSVNYGDFGIINSGYDVNTPTNSLGNIVRAADTYLYAQGNVSNTAQSGGNLVIGTATAGKTVKIFAGGNTASALVANISNTGVSVAGNVTASNFIGNISITGNIQGTTANVSLVAGSYTMTFDNTGILTLPAVGGSEGGEINLGIPTANTTLLTAVKFDVYQDRIRFFDGSTKGVYIDLSQAATGVGTMLNNRVSGLVNAGTFVTMDNIKATVTSSAPRGLSLATVSGSFSYNIGGNFALAGGPGGSVLAGQTLTTTPTSSIFGWGFSTSGDLSTYILTDTTNSRCYRITVQIGASFNNNSIIIERLI